MSGKEAKAVVPKLRFPEFREAGAWEVKRLGEIYRFKPTNSWSRDQLNYDSGTIKNIHYGDIHKEVKICVLRTQTCLLPPIRGL